jgi:hypothetical protein
MRKKRTIQLAAMNIVCHPHSEDIYRDLFKRIRSQNRAFRVHGVRFAKFTGLPSRISDQKIIGGHIATFVDINTDAPWLDLKTDKPAEPEATKAVNIPENLKPNLEEFPFRFDVTKHLLVYLAQGHKKGLAPNVALKFLKLLFSDESIKGELDSVAVTAVPDHEAVSEMLGSKSLRQISIILEAPNPADTDDARKAAMDRLKRQNAKSEQTVLTAEDDGFLTLDANSQALAKMASTNGEVIVRRLNREGRVISASTKDKPLLSPHSYETDNQVEYQAFESNALDLIAKIEATNVIPKKEKRGRRRVSAAKPKSTPKKARQRVVE